MVKHTINFQIGDQYTMKDLRAIARQEYAKQIRWSVSMTKNRGPYLQSLRGVIRDLAWYADRANAAVKNTDNICEVCDVEEDYNYLHVFFRCIHPDITNYIDTCPKVSSGKTQSSEDMYEHDESWYRDREHWSEFHGWNPR